MFLRAVGTLGPGSDQYQSVSSSSWHGACSQPSPITTTIVDGAYETELEQLQVSISFERALGPHADALALRSQRFGVLANNLANADTPGYQARDVDFRQALAARLAEPGHSGGLRATHAQHMPPGGQSMAAELAYRIPTLPSEDGNTVDVQIEQSQIAANNLETQVAMTFLGNRFQSLLTAVRGE